ncbi:hypothetical protein AB0H06_31225, partial [Streptomyces althioticus]
MPPRGSGTASRLPAARPPDRPASPVPLLLADGAAALLAWWAAAGHSSLLLALLAGASLLLRPRDGRSPVPALLEELPYLCGRVAVAWLAAAALWAALVVDHYAETGSSAGFTDNVDRGFCFEIT